MSAASPAVALPLPQPHDHVMAGETNPAEARKRRREILASQRSSNTTTIVVAATPDVSASADAVVLSESSKRRRVSNDFANAAVVSAPGKAAAISTTTITKPGKKPQMKYDPDVPMTKEEAAVWRREQRRKRNRESAAASRQRQRDRIVELEAEVDEWKDKFEEAMKRIRQLEEPATEAEDSSDMDSEGQMQQGQPSDQVITDNNCDNLESSSEGEEETLIHSPEALVEEVFKDTTILVSPSQSPRSVSPAGTPVIDYSQVQAVKVVSNVGARQVGTEQEQDQVVFQNEESVQPSKMISRPAVKISNSTGLTPMKNTTIGALPLLPDESMLSPDNCSSFATGNSGIKLEPITATNTLAVTIPMPNMAMLTDEEEGDATNEAELGEFLLDAVDWL